MHCRLLYRRVWWRHKRCHASGPTRPPPSQRSGCGISCGSHHSTSQSLLTTPTILETSRRRARKISWVVLIMSHRISESSWSELRDDCHCIITLNRTYCSIHSFIHNLFGEPCLLAAYSPPSVWAPKTYMRYRLWFPASVGAAADSLRVKSRKWHYYLRSRVQFLQFI